MPPNVAFLFNFCGYFQIACGFAVYHQARTPSRKSGVINLDSFQLLTRSNRVVEKPHNFDPTGGRKIMLDFVAEKSQKFRRRHRAVHAVPQGHWRLENLCARTNPLYYERQLPIATSRFREAPPTVLAKYNRSGCLGGVAPR